MRKFYMPLFFVVSLLLIFLSCRRNELQSNEPKPSDEYSRFFTMPASSAPQAKAIAEAVKKQNQKHKFLSSLIKKAGYPRWDKAKVINHADRTTSGRGSAEELVYIPLVRDSQNRVGAILAAQMASGDTLYRLLYDSRYKGFGYDTSGRTQWSARNAFLLFSLFDYSVFGHTKFVITDDSLYRRKTDSTSVVLTLKPETIRNFRAAVLSQVTECAQFTYCDIVSNFGCNCVRSSSSSECWDIEICTTYYYDWGGSGGGETGGWTGTGSGTGEPGGGGGSNGGWWSGDPCAGSPARTLRPALGSGCGTGWTVVSGGYNTNNINTLSNLLSQDPYYLVNPCEYISQYLQLVNLRAPQNVLDRLHQINQQYLTSPNPQYVQSPTYLQDINDASSAVVNFDYFPIHITALPKTNGVEWTPQQLFEHFRLNWNSFIDNSIATFYPYQDAIVNDVNLWNSSNPLTALLHLNMVQDGSVIVTHYNSTSNSAQLVVTTVRTPLDGLHPVSGNRAWGIVSIPKSRTV